MESVNVSATTKQIEVEADLVLGRRPHVDRRLRRPSDLLDPDRRRGPALGSISAGGARHVVSTQRFKLAGKLLLHTHRLISPGGQALSSTVLSPKSATTRRVPPSAATYDWSVPSSVCDRSPLSSLDTRAWDTPIRAATSLCRACPCAFLISARRWARTASNISLRAVSARCGSSRLLRNSLSAYLAPRASHGHPPPDSLVNQFS